MTVRHAVDAGGREPDGRAPPSGTSVLTRAVSSRTYIPGFHQRDPVACLISSMEWSDPCWALQAEVYSVVGLGIDQRPAPLVLFGISSKG